MKTKTLRKEINEKDAVALAALVAETREEIRKSRFGKAASGAAAKSPRLAPKTVARALTALAARKKSA